MEEKKLLHVLKLLLLLIISLESNSSDKLYIFVSHSMGKQLLKNYMKEAKLYNGTIVFNGLVNGSFRGFVDLVEEDSPSIIIHDDLFKKYQISFVPTFILLNDETGQFEKVTGNIGIKSALNIIENRGVR